ncbi:MAG: hypothetical protein MZV49_08130 [Rhodopseudomonas palustris]|nr:hypothetical protein [Rhodopseudomonas palustris]
MICRNSTQDIVGERRPSHDYRPDQPARPLRAASISVVALMIPYGAGRDAGRGGVSHPRADRRTRCRATAALCLQVPETRGERRRGAGHRAGRQPNDRRAPCSRHLT